MDNVPLLSRGDFQNLLERHKAGSISIGSMVSQLFLVRRIVLFMMMSFTTQSMGLLNFLPLKSFQDAASSLIPCELIEKSQWGSELT